MSQYWPLWWCLEAEAQALLMQFQWDTHGYRLQIPPEPRSGNIDTEIESPEEIGRIIRRAPSRSRG